MSKKYWKESLEEVLSHHGIEATEALIADIYTIREMESEGCGYQFIPNPMAMELAETKKELSKAKEAHETALYEIAANYADAHNMDRSKVMIDGRTNKMMFEKRLW